MAEKQKTPLGPTGETVRQNIERIRTAKRLTYVELSERLTELGRRIPVLGLRRIERGERRVDADDLMALAVALGVNVSALLLPNTAEGTVELTGVGTVDAKRAWQWADGMRPLRIPEGDDGTARVDFQRQARPAGLRRYGMTGPGRQALMEEYDGAPIRRRRDGTFFREWPDGRVEELDIKPFDDDLGE
ncbi:helix-turn-helix domain-containing protein [Streptomyces sp. NPDC007264]|uniref:helix-turn-helix domain-containing protein n=1 Tax=Streptomyces sp. NPDC007264 TaxID=3364777 RepID=UPI0036D7AABF